MASPRTADHGDPKLADAIVRNEASWVPVFLARAALGLPSVVLVSATPDGAGSVAILSSVEASALLRKRGDNRGSAKVAGTASPGSAWCIGLGEGSQSVWSLAMTPILTRAG
ncbi:MAG: hypothetical protein WCJ30_16395 [Deltaproteobacteria bacterium]